MKDPILDSMIKTAEAIANLFGEDCETIVHDFSKPVPPIVAIFNGHISHREVGSTASIYGKEISVEDCQQFIRNEDVTNREIVTPEGRVIKSTSVNFIGEGYHYVLGINYDVTALDMMNRHLTRLLKNEGNFDMNPFAIKTLDEAMEGALYGIGQTADRIGPAQRKYIVRVLNDQNLFAIQKAVPYVAEKLGVSRSTIYNYLNELNDEKRR